jgi:hypothetical protein
MQVEDNDNPRIREQFLAFIITEEFTGQKITEAFLSKDRNLSLEKKNA